MDFLRADSTNLPKVDNIMIVQFLSTSDKHNIAEIRGAKLLMSSRDSYIDTSVGHVEVKRDAQMCTVRAKVVPEHKISQKQYTVTAFIKENLDEIIDVSCDGCPAAAGGCKHTIVFLFWLEKRSSEPASTSIQCYWKKPKLSNVQTLPIAAEQIFPTSKKIKISPPDSSVLNTFIDQCKEHNVHCLASRFFVPKKTFNIFDLTLEYLNEYSCTDFNHYKETLDKKITVEVKDTICQETKSQADSVMWHYARQGRITASKIYEASKCTTDGSLVQQILGGCKVPETLAIIRGRKLEDAVVKMAEAQLNVIIEKAGFKLINSLVGASPDGLTEEFTVEVKCPFSLKTLKNYVDGDKIKEKCAAQMHAQMCAFNKKKGLLIVADPSFETSNMIFLHWLKYDEKIMKNLIDKSLSFWKEYIFRKVLASAKC